MRESPQENATGLFGKRWTLIRDAYARHQGSETAARRLLLVGVAVEVFPVAFFGWIAEAGGTYLYS